MRLCLLLLLTVCGLPAYTQQNCFQKELVDIADWFHEEPAEREYCVETYVNSVVGCKIPAITATTQQGAIINTDSLLGKVVVLNFWFTMCKPCLTEFPSLNKLATEFADSGVVFLSFAWDKKEKLDTFLLTHQLAYQVIPNAKALADTFRILPYPTNMIVSRQGRVTAVQHGGAITPDKALENYDKLKPLLLAALQQRP
ncbi:MAG: TlpA disulfide reductase family protein [Chitinophagales bacterium]